MCSSGLKKAGPHRGQPDDAARNGSDVSSHRGVYIEKAVSDGGDSLNLRGRVKTRNQIAQLGGEVFLNSLVIGDAAYEGDPGFVGEPPPKSAKLSASKPDAAPVRNLSSAPTGKVMPKPSV